MTDHLQYIFHEKKHPAFPMNLGSENEVNPPLDGHWIGKTIVQSIGLGDIHPASRGVAAHTAGLFRSVRGAKGGFPPWGAPQAKNFNFPPRGGSPS